MASDQTLRDFRLPASTGNALSIDSFMGKMPLALVFLPDEKKDAIRLLEEMNRRHREFGAERAQLLAVMRATAREVRDIADDHELSVPILADASGAMARDYEAAAQAVAVVADKEGNVTRRFPDLLDGNDPEQALEAVLYTVRTLATNSLEHDGQRE